MSQNKMNWIPLLFLLCGYCQGSSDTSIKQNRTRRTVYPVWKPPADKAYELCGLDLRDHEKCKLPPWCAGGRGRCCRGECICPTRFNPCSSLPETNTRAPTATTKRRGLCMRDCALNCYKACHYGRQNGRCERTRDSCTPASNFTEPRHFDRIPQISAASRTYDACKDKCHAACLTGCARR